MKKKLSLIILTGIMAIMTLSACSVSFTTANFQDLQMASEVDKNSNKPVTVTSTFQTTTPVIYLTGVIKNAPDGTVISGEWYYNDNDPAVKIDTSTLGLTQTDTQFEFELSKPTKGWPKGNYEVKLYIDEQYSTSVPFEVK